MPITISAIALAAHDMSRAVRFYRALGFKLRHGDERSSLASFDVGDSILITSAPQSASWRTAVGPERTRVRSITLNRERAPRRVVLTFSVP